MIVSIIVAVGKNQVIGLNGRIPWRLPADLKHFKELTMGHPIIMGRKTFQSLDKPLPGRTNIVLSRDPKFTAEAVIVESLDKALELARNNHEVFIIGGAEVYKEALPLADKIYLTMVNTSVSGDTFFPRLNPNEWIETEKKKFKPDDKNPYSYSFIVLERVGFQKRRNND